MSETSKGVRIVVSLAAAVVVIAGMRAAASLIVPLVAAVFLAVVCMPAVGALMRRGVKAWLAVTIVVLTLVVASVVAGGVATQAILSFTQQMPEYQTTLQSRLSEAQSYLERIGVPRERSQLGAMFDPNLLLSWFGTGLGAALGILRDGFFVLVMACFLLAEAPAMTARVRDALGDDDAHSSGENQAAAARTARVVDAMRTYLAVKTQTSALTGVSTWLLLWACGVDYALPIGLLAFLLNYVPIIGAIVAGVPAVLLALVQFGSPRAAVVLGLYLAINVAIGQVLEPRLFGRRLGLSAPAVLLSLVFWGWVLGPVGMFLCVPLTILAKIALDNVDELRWVSAILGPTAGNNPR